MAPAANVTFTSVPSSITKGNSGTFDTTTTGSLANATLYWVINNSTTTDSNFSAVTGSYTATGGTGSFSIVTVTDGISQADLTFTVSIWTGAGGTGALKATSSTVNLASPVPAPSGIAVASRITSAGVLSIAGEFDEVTQATIKLTSTFLYSNEFDEYTLQGAGGGLAKRETAAGKIQVTGYFDEYNKPHA